MSYQFPVWTTLPDLGTFPQDYSFDITPIQIVFGANSNTTVLLLNGALPLGLQWLQINNTINIFGAATESTFEITAKFTFRAIQTNGGLSDRTFMITLTPLVVAPSWQGQPIFLGYQSNVEIISYPLTATTSTGDHIIYDLPNNPTLATIGNRSGIFTLNALSLTSNVVVNTLVRATDSGTGGDSNIIVSVSVVTNPGPPRWITKSGEIGSYYGNDFVEYTLLAEDPFANSIAYRLVSYSQGFTLRLATPQPPVESGLLFGQLPNTMSIEIFYFTVSATSINGTSERTFSIIVRPAILAADFYWVTPSDLGSITEGVYAAIKVTATSNRNQTVIYNVTGGLLPPHLMLGTTSGLIEGFCEYTAVNKVWYFEITAFDGHEYLVQKFSLSVLKVYSNQYFNAFIPLTGSLRDRWSADTSNLRVREPGTVTFDSFVNIPNPPSLNIINGLVTGYSTPDQILTVIQPWWHELNLQIGSAANTAVLSNGLSTVYRNINDSQGGSNAVIADGHVRGGKVYPISIHNIRSALTAAYPYISTGSGSGFAMMPNLNWSTGAISTVTVLDTGAGYLSPPKITVGGAGTGAVLQAVLGLIAVGVASSGSGWSVGDTFALLGNDAIVPAELTVTAVNSAGQAVSFEITLSGSYKDVGVAPTTQVILGTATAALILTWGIVAVEVIQGGANYQCGITIDLGGGEILPPWQNVYSPAIAVGDIPLVSAGLATNILNTEPTTLFGTVWQPNYMVLQFQGILWIGNTTFDYETTTFDGNTTRFQDTESPLQTIFDKNNEIFDSGGTIFDYKDPLSYDLFQVWGSTLIDAGTTVFDLYSTIFDSLAPRTFSNTRLQKWVNTQNKIYSGNNAVW